ncbi:MutS domain V [Natronincola peptidivorans]|uniref:MutS domain V n=1 Tax=Natronincola peptidivorans TaxID=426128 RepID=A0A1I0CA27_9FIRM|nr:MutS family DNA mismatch repair protein [Natronincola peptidivorans]SET16428.1 MutS domain V [Natronincola peptidivorans]
MIILKKQKHIYEKRWKYYDKKWKELEKSINNIGNWRLITAITGIIVAGISNRMNLYYLFWSSMIIFIGIFVYLVAVYNRVKNFNHCIQLLRRINETAMDRLHGKWTKFKDTGEEFRDESHQFSQDLDIFGKGSLFQWTNTAETYHGRKKLNEFLTKPCHSSTILYKRQETIKELSRKLWWRQKFQMEAMRINDKKLNEATLLNWATHQYPFYRKKWVGFGIKLLPIATILSIFLAFGAHRISKIIPILAIIIHICLLLIKVKKRNHILNTVFQYKNNIKTYGKMLIHFETTSYDSKYIKDLQKSLVNQEGTKAFHQINKLETLVDSISNRSNFVFLPINIITLWDYQCMVALERWKEQSGGLIEKWLEVLGEMEALSSLASISFDYPHWTMPKFTEKPSVFETKNLGHPLLTNNQVDNDVTIMEPSRILLITGSNMSGKSTLLRTAGINLVLAYSGAPVCASYFQCSFMKIFTCMRISDNLEKSISSFYAELLRIKEIVKAAEGEGQVFFLLDEVFKGTNSQDRHIGAKRLINKLYGLDSMGMVSTHDLELGEIEKESNGKIRNYHFQEYYKDNKIYFDYKLRPGVSTTRNALYLIKMAGIEG